MSLKFLFLILSLMTSLTAKADILFFDFNGAPEEKAAAERAANARGEKMIVIPNTSTAEMNKFNASSSELSKVYWTLQSTGCFNEKPPSACEGIRQKHNDLEAKIIAHQKKYNIDSDSVQKVVNDLAKNGTQVSSIVISGHDGNGDFGGTYGMMSSLEFAKMAQDNPKVFENMRGLMLWGCYTATPGEVELNWKKAFPNVELIAGYDGRAPLANSPSSSKYLEDVLKKEKTLAKIKDRSELEKQFKGLQDISNVHGALCAGDLYASRKGVLDMVILKEMCKSMPLEKWNERVSCYKTGQMGCEDVPKDTSHGELRQIYNEVQAHTHCNEFAGNSGRQTPNADEIIRLIYFGNVKDNLNKNHRDEIASLNEILSKLGASNGLSLKDLDKLSRADLIKSLQNIDNFLTERSKAIDPLQDPHLAELLAAKSLTNGIALTLSDIQPRCSPFRWVEPNEGGKSDCINLASPSASQRRAEKYRTESLRSRVSEKVNDVLAADEDMKSFKAALLTDADADNYEMNNETKKIVEEVSKKIFEKRSVEIQKIVADQKRDLSRQVPISKGADVYNREDYLNDLENPVNIQMMVQGQVFNEFYVARVKKLKIAAGQFGSGPPVRVRPRDRER